MTPFYRSGATLNSQWVLQEDTSPGTHEHALPEDTLVLTPLVGEGYVEGVQPEIEGSVIGLQAVDGGD